SGRARITARVQNLRGVQARRRARVPAREAACVRLECFRDGAGAGYASIEPVQEDRALRFDSGDGELMPDRDWEKELAKVDKQLASLSDEALLGPSAVAPSGKGEAGSGKAAG